MERFVAPMATWEIVGGDLPPVRVRARTFDEALAKARLRDPGYCAGCEPFSEGFERTKEKAG